MVKKIFYASLYFYIPCFLLIGFTSWDDVGIRYVDKKMEIRVMTLLIGWFEDAWPVA